MNICTIGTTGHMNYVVAGLKELPHIRWVGAAAGSVGETLDKAAGWAQQAERSPQLYGDYREMLDQLRPDIVAIACHFGDHARIAAEALERGIHVYVEKPVATTFEDLAMLKDAYARSGKQLAAMHGMRYMPPFAAARQAVLDGAIGRVRLIHGQKSYKLGVRGDHYRNRASYGGTIPWVGSHAVDWVLWMSGELFRSVFASHSTADNRGHGELEMTALCHFTMTNDVFASVSIDYLRPERAPSHSDDRIRIAGTNGVLEVRDGRVTLINGETDGIRELPLPPKAEPFSDFVRQIETGTPCRISAEDSFLVTEACLKARLSADEKRPVEF